VGGAITGSGRGLRMHAGSLCLHRLGINSKITAVRDGYSCLEPFSIGVGIYANSVDISSMRAFGL
jgi:hypothetical protein